MRAIILILPSGAPHLQKLFRCGWYLVARVEGFGSSAWLPAEEMLAAPLRTRYLQAIYWALGMLAGLVSGERPSTEVEGAAITSFGLRHVLHVHDLFCMADGVVLGDL